MDQRQMEQTLTGLLMTAIEGLRTLEPYCTYLGQPDYVETHEKIRDMAAYLNSECWGVSAGIRTGIEDIRLSKIETAINALCLTDEEIKNINFYAENKQCFPPELT